VSSFVSRILAITVCASALVSFGCAHQAAQNDPNTPSVAKKKKKHVDDPPADGDGDGDADSEAAKFAGTWVTPNTAGKTHTTIAIRGGRPTVVKSVESIGDQEAFEVRTSRWRNGTLEWSYYVPSTQYLVTYACSSVEDDALVCRWHNDHGMSGSAKLPRVVGAGGDGASDNTVAASPELRVWEGIWQDPDTAYKTQMTIVLRGGAPTLVRSAEPVGDREVYEVRSSSFSGSTLRFAHYVPSTQYLVTYTCTRPRGETMSCSWFNDHSASGTVTLERVGGAPSSGSQQQAGNSATNAWLGVWQDPNTAYAAQMTVVLRGGVPTVTRSAETTGDLETYEVRSSSFQGGTLRWSHWVASTSYLVTYTCTAVRGDTMSCTWFNDHNRSGSTNLNRVGGATQPQPPPPPPPPVPGRPRPKDDSRD
jgi:hypothetical protein